MKRLFILVLALVFASGFVFAQSNEADISTAGNNNTATIGQVNTGGAVNKAVINQTANESIAVQDQNGYNLNANILQQGQTWSPAGIGPVVSNSAYQTQTGEDHVAQIRQVTDAGYGNSQATQLQSGTNHYAKAWQFSWNSSISQQQSGSAQNWAEAYQKGNVNSITQIQAGEGNIAVVDEQEGWGGVGSSASQIQTGRWNHTLAGQYVGTGNTATITQTGDDNIAGRGQGGGGQYGIYQSGDGNTGTITQELNVNWAKMEQLGNDNTATIGQTGGTGLFNTYGDYVNKATVMQNGHSNTATVTQQQ